MRTVWWKKSRAKVEPKRRDFLTKLAHPTADTFAMKGVAPHELKYFMDQIKEFYDILTRAR